MYFLTQSCNNYMYFRIISLHFDYSYVLEKNHCPLIICIGNKITALFKVSYLKEEEKDREIKIKINEGEKKSVRKKFNEDKFEK